MQFVSSLSNPDFRKQFLNHGLAIDCELIELTQNGVQEPKKYSGAGSLDLSANDRIMARIILIQPGDPVASAFERLKEMESVKSGEIIPDHHSFTLRAVQPNGEVWHCTEVAIKEEQHNNHTTLDLSCYWVEKRTKVEGAADYVHMLLANAIEFPENSYETFEITRDGAKTRGTRRIGSHGLAGGAKIRYRTHEAPNECYEFIAEPIEGSLPLNFADKLIEAIRFVTASSVSFAVCESVREGIRTLEIAKPRQAKNGLLDQPLADRPHLANDFYQLFDCYLRYAMSDDPTENFAFISKAMLPLYGLAEVSLDAIALLVSVTIESIVQREFDEFGKPNPAALEDVKSIRAAINGLGILQSTKNRALGSFSNWNDSRVKDKFIELRDNGKVTQADIKNWGDLRNKSAHGSLHKSGNGNQDLLDRVFKASAFLHRLVFLAIGYKGKFTDYSTRGWPEVDFNIDLHSAAATASLVAPTAGMTEG